MIILSIVNYLLELIWNCKLINNLCLLNNASKEYKILFNDKYDSNNIEYVNYLIHHFEMTH